MADPVAKKPMFSQEETNYELKIPYLKRLFKFLLPYKKMAGFNLDFHVRSNSCRVSFSLPFETGS